MAKLGQLFFVNAYSNKDSVHENKVKEFSLGLEFNFMSFDLHDTKKKVTPYFSFLLEKKLETTSFNKQEENVFS